MSSRRFTLWLITNPLQSLLLSLIRYLLRYIHPAVNHCLLPPSRLSANYTRRRRFNEFLLTLSLSLPISPSLRYSSPKLRLRTKTGLRNARVNCVIRARYLCFDDYNCVSTSLRLLLLLLLFQLLNYTHAFVLLELTFM